MASSWKFWPAELSQAASSISVCDSFGATRHMPVGPCLTGPGLPLAVGADQPDTLLATPQRYLVPDGGGLGVGGGGGGPGLGATVATRPPGCMRLPSAKDWLTEMAALLVMMGQIWSLVALLARSCPRIKVSLVRQPIGKGLGKVSCDTWARSWRGRRQMGRTCRRNGRWRRCRRGGWRS